MKRIALAPLVLAAAALRWLNGKPDPRAAHRMIVAVVAVAALIAILSPAPASADHGHNCNWINGGWAGQGLCPGMPGFEWHGPEPTTPTAEPSPTTTPAPTTPPVTPSPTTTAPSPTSTAPAPTATTPAPTSTSTPTSTATPTSTRTGCLTSYGNTWCTGGATPSTSTTTPAPVVTGPVVDTDIPYEHRNHPRGW